MATESSPPYAPRAPATPNAPSASTSLERSPEGVSRPRVDHGRLGVYAAMGAGTGAVPLPWVPDALARRVRGSLVHDIAVRHGVVLDAEARKALAERAAPSKKRGLVRQAVRFVGSTLAKRALTGLGPVALIGPLRAALDTYVLGHLFDRHLERRPRGGAMRIGEEEALRVRKAVDGALLRALTVDVDPVVPPARPDEARDEARDEATTLIDGALSFAAGVPEQLIVRLDAAFDDIMSHELA